MSDEKSDENVRPMTGFWATLTAEQKSRALAYRGPENHGDPEFAARAAYDAKGE